MEGNPANNILDLAREIDNGLQGKDPSLGELTEKLDRARLELDEIRSNLVVQTGHETAADATISSLISQLNSVDLLDASSNQILEDLAFAN